MGHGVGMLESRPKESEMSYLWAKHVFFSPSWTFGTTKLTPLFPQTGTAKTLGGKGLMFQRWSEWKVEQGEEKRSVRS